jgi:hypothetical protein
MAKDMRRHVGETSAPAGAAETAPVAIANILDAPAAIVNDKA